MIHYCMHSTAVNQNIISKSNRTWFTGIEIRWYIPLYDRDNGIYHTEWYIPMVYGNIASSRYTKKDSSYYSFNLVDL